MQPRVDLELYAPLEVARWRPLVHWLAAIPQLVVASVLGYVGGVLSVLSWFVIVFTGRLPGGIADFQCLVLRYEARATSYVLALREPYPPFEFEVSPADPRTDPLVVEVRPQLTDRNRLTVGLRFLWIIPIAVFAWLVGLAAMFVAVIGWIAVVLTGRWPDGLRRFMVGAGRLMLRVNAYAALLVDDYPPFATE